MDNEFIEMGQYPSKHEQISRRAELRQDGIASWMPGQSCIEPNRSTVMKDIGRDNLKDCHLI